MTKIPDDKREAVQDAIIDLLQTPKYVMIQRPYETWIELNHEWEYRKGPPKTADVVPDDMIFRKVYCSKDHKKDARLMWSIMNADAIVEAIEAVI